MEEVNMSTGISQCHKCGAIYDDDEACICSDPKDKTEAVYLDVKHLENMYELMKTVNDRNMKEKHSLAARVKTLEAENSKLRTALKQIALGDGYYGAQAKEYKEIARKALKKGDKE